MDPSWDIRCQTDPVATGSSVASPSSSAAAAAVHFQSSIFYVQGEDVRLLRHQGHQAVFCGSIARWKKNNQLRKKCRWHFMTIPTYSNNVICSVTIHSSSCDILRLLCLKDFEGSIIPGKWLPQGTANYRFWSSRPRGSRGDCAVHVPSAT